MDYRQIMRQASVGRIVVGTALTVAPGLAGQAWIGRSAREPATKVAIRALGIRDLALGAGALHALDSGAPPRPWTIAGAVSDIVDAIGTVLALRRLPRRSLGVVVVAAASAALHLVAADQLD
jgi:hypothetical protein